MYHPKIRKKATEDSANQAGQILGRSRPFSNEVNRTLNQPEQQEKPDLQNKIIQAKRFGHNFGNLLVTGDGFIDANPKPIIQTKLTIGTPGDKYEQEADHMAQKVMSTASPVNNQPIQKQEATETPEEEETTNINASLIQKQAETSAPEQEEEEETTNINASLIQKQADNELLQRKESAANEGQNNSNLESQLSASRGSGSALPDEVRSYMEPRFGADFSSVRVHTDSTAVQMNQEIGAQAFTHGSDIYFGARKSPGKNELTAHELTHVVQQNGPVVERKIQSKLTTSLPKDASEQEANAVANQVMTGDKVKVSQSTVANIHGDWLTDTFSNIGNAVGDALNIRDNEAALDEWEDYQEAMEELREFRSSNHTAENFQSSTRLGMFDAIYNPTTGTLNIVCKCKFNFLPGSPTEFPSADPAALTWTDQKEMNDWKSRFISTVSSKWSSGNHIFYCQKPWWESLVARVAVEIREVESDEHFALNIAKIPKGEFRQSSVTSPVVLPLVGAVTGGTGDFDSEDLEQVSKPGGMQTPAVHEAGHMLGLDDEYGTGTPSHSDLVESEFGHGVARGSDGRIMSGGDDIQPEHGITFLEALKEATGIDDWTATMCPIPRQIPTNPNPSGGVGDYPQPNPNAIPA